MELGINGKKSKRNNYTVLKLKRYEFLENAKLKGILKHSAYVRYKITTCVTLTML